MEEASRIVETHRPNYNNLHNAVLGEDVARLLLAVILEKGPSSNLITNPPGMVKEILWL